MQMTIEVDMSTETVMQKMLGSHGLNYVLWLLLKNANYPEYESLADKITKIVSEVTE